MDEIAALEKEVVSLRATLAEKEAHLNALRRIWMPESTIQPAQAEPPYEQPQYAELRPPVAETLPRWAIERYSRQILLPQLGVEGQRRLCDARVLVVGAGGLGCPAAAYLAGAGVGVIGLVDYDTVDVSNLHRQLLHGEPDCGGAKVESAARALRRLNSRVRVQCHRAQLTSANALELLAHYDAALDCSDNVPTRYLLNDACVLLKIPLISGSALKMEGQVTIYGYRPHKEQTENPSSKPEQPEPGGPCYRCLFPTPPPPETVGSCSAQGVLGAVTGVVGALQALETLKLLARRPRGELLVARMLLVDGEDCTFRSVKLRPRSAECAACSDRATVTQLLDYEAFCRTEAKEKKKERAQLRTLCRQEEKEKRMSGRSYFGFRKTGNESKEKWIQDVPKRERKMGPPCGSDYCAKGLTRSCAAFTEGERLAIFTSFWHEMDWTAKRGFVRSLVDSAPPKRRRAKHKGDVSRKGDSKLYHLARDGGRVPVCRVMFLSTLGIKEAMVRCWLAEEAERPRLPRKKPHKALNVQVFLDGLPKYPPRCPQCRTATPLLYLEPGIKNRHQLYNRYVSAMSERGVAAASRKTFTKVFLASGLGIFRPRQEGDVCDLFGEHNAARAQAEVTVGPVMVQRDFQQW